MGFKGHPLTPEQRAAVFRWIEEREEDLTSACKRIFAEFGVKIGKQMVFYQSRKSSLVRRNLREQAEAARVDGEDFTEGNEVNEEGRGRKTRIPIDRDFELEVAELVMKHIDKLKSSGALQIEDRSEAAKKIREQLFGKYTKEQVEEAGLATG